MLVDDEPDVLATTRKMLEKNGYHVHAFGNPEKALQHIKEGCKECELLISDIKMQGLSGFELVRRVKEMRPELKVLLTSSFIIHKGEFEKVLPSIKVNDFVQKPYTKNDLIEAIRKYAK
jgi:DNA-binding NtrC family response regulator